MSDDWKFAQPAKVWDGEERHPQPQVLAEITKLRNEIAKLREIAGLLVDALSPVSRRGDERQLVTDKMPDNLVPLAQELRALGFMVAEATVTLNDACERLEL